MSRPSRKIIKLRPFGEFIMSKRASASKMAKYHETQLNKTEPEKEQIKYINVSAKTSNQKDYLRSISSKKITIGIGCAGCGKTFLAVAAAVKSVIEGEFKKIVICRPAIEAGNEHLGFLPGTADEKVSVYLQPIFYAIDELIPNPAEAKRFKTEHIDIIQFAFMRGLTFRDKIVIADECQNLNDAQIDLLVTRFGNNCKMIINGDLTQSDLNIRDQGALDRLARIVAPSPRFGIVRFDTSDIIRDELVAEYLNLKAESERPRDLGERFQGYHERDDYGGW